MNPGERNPQMIDAPNGERMVVLPLREYENLCEAAEELANVQAYDNVAVGL